VVLDCLSEGGGGVVRPSGWGIYLCVDRPGPWWTESLMEKPTFTKMNLSNVRVIMSIIGVLVAELLSQVVMGEFQYSSAHCQVHLDACGYVLSCLSLNGAASQGPNSRGTCLVLEPPGVAARCLGVC
jgi:hypothetical protein